MEEGGGSWKKPVECCGDSLPSSDRWAGLALVGNGRMTKARAVLFFFRCRSRSTMLLAYCTWIIVEDYKLGF
jgi:hypothetical protein